MGVNFPHAPKEARDYRVTFEETFTAPISVRPFDRRAKSDARWSTRTWYEPGWHDYGKVVYDSAEFGGKRMFDQGYGHIRMFGGLGPKGPKNALENPDAKAREQTPHVWKPYAGSILTTDLSFQQQYGWFEARIKVAPGSVNYWPAFWLWGPNSEEIDVFEGWKDVSKTQNIISALHIKDKGFHQSLWPKRAAGFDPTVWHTYGVLWGKDEIAFYVDGKETVRAKNPGMHSPMFIVLSNSLNGPGPVNKGMYVDSVRVGANA